MTKIFEILKDSRANLTRSEKKAADFLLRNYPMVGLERITDFAEAAKVSTATIQRFVSKLGLAGYPDLRRALTEELIETRKGPLTLSDRVQPTEHSDALRASLINAVKKSVDALPPDEIAAIAQLIADTKSHVWLLGGAFTMPLAEHLDFMLRKLRTGVTLMPSDPTRRADHLLNVRKGDVLLAFDIRRYQPDIREVASFVAARGGRVVLFTDEWMSDIAKSSKHVVSCWVDVGTPWDSLLGLMASVELLAAACENLLLDERNHRLEQLEQFKGHAFVPDRSIKSSK